MHFPTQSGDSQIVLAAQPVSQGPGEILGVAFALVILVIVFGSLLAALMPIITTLVAIVIGTSLIGLLSHALSIASFVSELSILIGLGVGVDHALFIISRHRAGVKAGRHYEDSVANAQRLRARLQRPPAAGRRDPVPCRPGRFRPPAGHRGPPAVGAAFGVLQAVFTWGWGLSLLGVKQAARAGRRRAGTDDHRV